MAGKKECVDCGKMITHKNPRCLSCINRLRWAEPGRKERQRELMSTTLRENSKRLWTEPEYLEKQPEWRKKANEVRWNNGDERRARASKRAHGKIMSEYWADEKNREAQSLNIKEYLKSIGHVYADSEYSHEFMCAREVVRERDKWQCTLCCKDETAEGRQMSVHHLDGDKRNNATGNLVSLCRVCHGKVHQRNPWFWRGVLTHAVQGIGDNQEYPMAFL